MKMGAGRDGVFVRWSIPGLKLVPACSPNGSIDHYSVPFSNQRTATLVCPTQERTHFNWEKQTDSHHATTTVTVVATICFSSPKSSISHNALARWVHSDDQLYEDIYVNQLTS